MQQDNQSELYLYEWFALLVIVGAICTLAASAYLIAPPLTHAVGPPHHLIDNTVEVFVQGSVQFPGPRSVPRGSTIQDVLDAAVPLSDANLTRLNLQGKVRTNQVIKVPAKRPLKRAVGRVRAQDQDIRDVQDMHDKDQKTTTKGQD